MALLLVSLVVFVICMAFVEGAYLGCFIDNADRLIKENRYHDSQLTTDQCIQYCFQHGNILAGTQFSTHCFCGNDIDMTQLTTDDACSQACGGNQSETCGGTWRMSVYSIDTPTTISDIQTTADTQTTISDIQTTADTQTTAIRNTTVQTSIADSQTIAGFETTDIQNITVQTSIADIQTTADTQTTDIRDPTVQTSITDSQTTADTETTDIWNIADRNTVITTLSVETGNSTLNCTCCKNKWNKSTKLSREQQQKILYQLQSLLTVTKKSTSNFKRKFISEHDSRPSSIAIGYFAGVVLSVITGVIVVPDFTRMVLHVRKRRGSQK
ncbi:uncharacterized protein in LEU2 3'region-like [Mizuhopecten yessoensis]|uniref:uncharacterized protein in LEU2 3'region-like n=1 Tax=Mizuhopecten yessoensis TaxID=6573 RepID=UPI000B45C42E|nr:uncharacterized protein in LEU2 3'region-like [Mizuhopecten yessoensis]